METKIIHQLLSISLPMLVTGIFGYATAAKEFGKDLEVARESVSAQLVDTLIDRVSDLESKKTELEKTLTVQSGELLTLRAAATAGERGQKRVLRNMLNSLPGPAWIKRVIELPDGRVEFRNYLINRAYEVRFDVTQERYANKTDDQVWRDSRAIAGFRDTDLWVWQNKQSLETRELFPDTVNQLSSESPSNKIPFVWKGLVTLPNDQYGIAGLTFETPEQLQEAARALIP